MTIQIHVGSFVNNTTNGTQTITGVGFTPKLLIFHIVGTNTTGFQSDSTVMIGFGTSISSTEQKSLFIQGFDASAPSDVDSSFKSNAIWHEQLFPGIGLIGTITELNSDGFKITWSNAGGTIHSYVVTFMAIGGDDLVDAHTGQFNAPSSTGDQSITGIGFQPDCVILLGTNHTTDNTLTDDFGTYSYGFANSSLEMGATAGIIENGVATMDTARYQRTDKVLAMFNVSNAASLTHEATLSSMDGDGFTLNYTTASTASKRVAYVALKGGSYKIGSFTAPTTGSPPISQSTTGVGFQSRGIMFLSVGNTASSSIANHMRLSAGFADSNANEFCNWLGDEDAAASQVTASRTNNDAVIRVSDEALSMASSTTEALADYTSMDPDGFTLNWSVRATSNAYQILYLAIGDAPVTAVQQELRKYSFSMLSPVNETTSKKRYISTSFI